MAFFAGACQGHFWWFQRRKLGDNLYFLRLFSSSPISQPALPAVADLSAAVLGYNEGRWYHRFQSDIGIGFEQKRRSHYASAVARTASPSKSSLKISSTAMMTATQALFTLLLHRAVDAQQPKHRPLHGLSPPMTMINRSRSVALTSSLRMRTTSRSALDRSKERQAPALGSALRRWHRSC